METLGEKIRKERRARGMTQRDLAGETGVEHTIISRIESGNRDASPEALLRLCIFLDMRADADAELAARGIPSGDLITDVPNLPEEDQKKLAAIQRKPARLSPDKRSLALSAMAGVISGIGN